MNLTNRPTESWEQRKLNETFASLSDELALDQRCLKNLKERDVRGKGSIVTSHRMRHDWSWTTRTDVFRPAPHPVSALSPEGRRKRQKRLLKTTQNRKLLTHDRRSSLYSPVLETKCLSIDSGARYAMVSGCGIFSRIFGVSEESALVFSEVKQNFAFLPAFFSAGKGFGGMTPSFAGYCGIRRAALIQNRGKQQELFLLCFTLNNASNDMTKPKKTTNYYRAYQACELLGVFGTDATEPHFTALYSQQEEGLSLEGLIHRENAVVNISSTPELVEGVECVLGEVREFFPPHFYLEGLVEEPKLLTMLPAVLYQGLPVWVHENHESCGGFLLSDDATSWVYCPDTFLLSDHSFVISYGAKTFFSEEFDDIITPTDCTFQSISEVQSCSLTSYEANQYNAPDIFDHAGKTYKRMVTDASNIPHEWTSNGRAIYTCESDVSGGIVLSPNNSTPWAWLLLRGGAYLNENGGITFESSFAEYEHYGIIINPEGEGEEVPWDTAEFTPIESDVVVSVLSNFAAVVAPLRTQPCHVVTSLMKRGKRAFYRPSYGHILGTIHRSRENALQEFERVSKHLFEALVCSQMDCGSLKMEELLRDKVVAGFSTAGRGDGVLWGMAGTFRDLYRAARDDRTIETSTPIGHALCLFFLEKILLGNIPDSISSARSLPIRRLRKTLGRDGNIPRTFDIPFLGSDLGVIQDTIYAEFTPMIGVDTISSHLRSDCIRITTTRCLSISKVLQSLSESSETPLSLWYLPPGVYKVEQGAGGFHASPHDTVVESQHRGGGGGGGGGGTKLQSFALPFLAVEEGGCVVVALEVPEGGGDTFAYDLGLSQLKRVVDKQKGAFVVVLFNGEGLVVLSSSMLQKDRRLLEVPLDTPGLKHPSEKGFVGMIRCAYQYARAEGWGVIKGVHVAVSGLPKVAAMQSQVLAKNVLCELRKVMCTPVSIFMLNSEPDAGEATFYSDIARETGGVFEGL